MNVRRIPLALIDEPVVAMREEMDEPALRELADSITALGLLQPIVVRPRGDRFEIIAGHRRFLAHKIANLFEIDASIVNVNDDVAEAMKMAENVDREGVNAADEAGYLAIILEKFCDNDFDRLVTYTRKSASYLNDRLVLLRGHERVFAALKANEINLSVASELNRFKDPLACLQHLELCARQGMTAAAVKVMRKQYELMADRNADAIAAGDAARTIAPTGKPCGPVCVVCRVDDDPGNLQYLYVHNYCDKAVLQKLLAPTQGS